MQRLSRKYAVAGLVVIMLFAIASYFHTKTFRGKVLDADTQEPIEGAVVVAEWQTETNTPTATHTDLKDVKEVLTDKNGEWPISGIRTFGPIPVLSLFIPFTRGPQFTIFKPGYCPWPVGFYIGACRERMKFTADKEERIGAGGTLEPPKLTNREDRWKAEGINIDPTGEIFANKQKAKKIKNFLRLLNQERRFLGLDEYPIGKELENEK